MNRASAFYRMTRGAVQTVSRILALTAAGCILVMMLVMSAEVTSRASGNGSLPWAYGLVQLLLVAAVFLAAAFSEQLDEQIRVNLFTARMAPRTAAIARIVGNVLTLAVVLMLTIATSERAIEATGVGEYQDGVIAFPIWPARILIAIGLAVLALELTFKVTDGIHSVSKPGSTDSEFANQRRDER